MEAGRFPTLGTGLAPNRQRIETGKYDSSLPSALKIAQVFATSIEQIFNEATGDTAQE